MNETERTRKLIQIESTNPGCYEKDIADYLEGVLCGSNIRTVRKEVLPGRPVLMAELGGNSSFPALVIICHMDTVPLAGGWSRDPLAAEETDGKIYGRGACDMKSGLAAALTAFLETAEDLRRTGEKPDKSIRMIFTMDEEGDMLGAAAAIQEGFVGRADYVLDTEPTDGQIQTAHKSRYWFRYTMHGCAAHASKPWEGADAISGMAVAVTEIRRRIRLLQKDDFLGPSTVTFGEIRGGIHPYQVPAECTVSVDMRIVPPYSAEDMRQILLDAARLAAGEIPGLTCTAEITGNRPSVPHHPESPLLRLLLAATESVAGKPAEVASFPGYTDTAVIAGQLGNENTMSYGPGSLDQAHKPDEYVMTADIRRCKAVYAELFRQYLSL